LNASVEVFTQRPAHAVWPVGHAHRPAAHVAPVGQTAPHAPQLRGSLVASTHPPPQARRGDVHDAAGAHPPARHKLPDVHALPHAPQWLKLVVASTSQPLAALPSQSAAPVWHTQRPKAQV